MPSPSEREPDPPEHQRTYFTSTKDGERGFMVMRDGVEHIKLDRPNQEILRKYKAGDWELEHRERRYGRMQLARVTFEADRALCVLLGYVLEARQTWAMMREDDRIAWAANGPGEKAHPKRRQYWRMGMRVLEPMEKV